MEDVRIEDCKVILPVRHFTDWRVAILGIAATTTFAATSLICTTAYNYLSHVSYDILVYLKKYANDIRHIRVYAVRNAEKVCVEKKMQSEHPDFTKCGDPNPVAVNNDSGITIDFHPRGWIAWDTEDEDREPFQKTISKKDLNRSGPAVREFALKKDTTVACPRKYYTYCGEKEIDKVCYLLEETKEPVQTVVSDDVVSDDDVLDILEIFSFTELNDVYTRLGLEQNRIDNAMLDGDTRKVKERKVFKDWRDREGYAATRGKLFEAMGKCPNCKLFMEKLKTKWGYTL